jgi:hypothetical protein
MLLKVLGYDVTYSRTRHQALELMRERPFDAVLIQEADAEPETINFTLDAHRTRPEVPIFLVNAWAQTWCQHSSHFALFADDATSSDLDEAGLCPGVLFLS